MADRVIPLKMIKKIWNKSIEDNSKSLEYLEKERKLTTDMYDVSQIGYIDYLRLDSSFFLKDVIVFPLYDALGAIKGVTTRKLYDKFFIKFVSSNYPLIFSDYEFVGKTLVLTESPICALTLRSFLPDMSVSASLSASMPLPYLILYSTARKIITVMDNDDAGKRASANLQSINPKTYNVPAHYFEDLKDPNDLFKEDIDAFETMVNYIKTVDRKTK